jgi:hypothetical protein
MKQVPIYTPRMRSASTFGVCAAILRGVLVTVVTALVAGHLTAAASQEIDRPVITGPIRAQGQPGDPDRDYIFYSTPMNLASVGYIEQEYFISGIATRYAIPGAGEATSIGTMPYKTRIVVRRPSNSAKFAGVVVIDWQNVTAGHDIDSEWAAAGEFFVRSGWAWVGASVQRIGVHGFDSPNPLTGRGLKQWNPTRYGSLDLTNRGTVIDDSQSYDIYSQVARLIRQSHGANPFEGMTVRRVYAGGASQSANFLVRYYNSVQPHAKVYDGFLVGVGGASPRLDIPTKIFKVQTETDVWRSQAAVRVDDTATTHTWEIAGAAHVMADALSSDMKHFRAFLGGIAQRDVGPPTASRCAQPYPSDVETWAVYSAAYAALDRWVSKNVRPSTADPIRVSSAPPPPAFATIVRDANGIAAGGIQLPRVAVPIAVNTGENHPADPADASSRFCILFGTRAPFDSAKLKALYPTRAAYLRAVKQVVNALVERGFVLEADAPTLIRNAETANVAK